MLLSREEEAKDLWLHPYSGKTHGEKELQAILFHPHARKASRKSGVVDLHCSAWHPLYIESCQVDLHPRQLDLWFMWFMVWNGTMPQTTNWPCMGLCLGCLPFFLTESCVYYITYSWDGLKSKAPERAILWTSGLCDNPRFRNLMFSYSFETTPNGFKPWFPVCLSYFLIVIHKMGPPSYKLVYKPHCLYS